MGESANDPQCPDCDGEGYSPEARAVANTFYPHQVGGYNADNLAWHDKLGQAEVDNLVEHERLRVWRDGQWNTEPRSAESVNAENRPGAREFGHDAVNRWILIEFRCERLGIPLRCPTCSGNGTITDEQHDSQEGSTS